MLKLTIATKREPRTTSGSGFIPRTRRGSACEPYVVHTASAKCRRFQTVFPRRGAPENGALKYSFSFAYSPGDIVFIVGPGGDGQVADSTQNNVVF